MSVWVIVEKGGDRKVLESVVFMRPAFIAKQPKNKNDEVWIMALSTVASGIQMRRPFTGVAIAPVATSGNLGIWSINL